MKEKRQKQLLTCFDKNSVIQEDSVKSCLKTFVLFSEKNVLLPKDLVELEITHCSCCYSATNHRVSNLLPVNTSWCMSRLEMVMWRDAFSGVLVCWELKRKQICSGEFIAEYGFSVYSSRYSPATIQSAGNHGDRGPGFFWLTARTVNLNFTLCSSAALLSPSLAQCTPGKPSQLHTE